MNNQSYDEKPLKHVERPSESRSEMHHHSAHTRPQTKPSHSQSHQVRSTSDQTEGKKNSTKIWAGLIILAILVIALIPIINEQFHQSKTNLAEKKVQTTKVSSSIKKSSKSVSKKSVKKTKKKNTENKKKSDFDVKTEDKSNSNNNQISTPNTDSQQNSNTQSDSGYANYSATTSASNQNQQATQPSFYQVKDGDSLSKIAAETGTNVENLKQINGMSDDIVNPGQSIKLK